MLKTFLLRLDTVWLLFIICFMVYFSSAVGIMNSADAPEYALTQAMVEERTFSLDHFTQWIHPDYAVYNNHLFSLRPPGASFAAIPFYILAKIISPLSLPPYLGRHPGINEASKIEAVTMLFPAFFGALTVLILYYTCLALTRDKSASLLASFCLGFGTLLWKYSTGFQRHPVVAAFLILALFLFVSSSKNGIRRISVLAIGLSLGSVLVSDLSLVFSVLVFSIFTIREVTRRAGGKQLLFFLIGFVAPLSLNLYYNHSAFGNILKTGRDYYAHSYRWWFKDYRYVFGTPLLPALKVMLFSSQPIPREATAAFLWENPPEGRESVEWATSYKFKGIFTQSPYLWLAVIGFLLFLQRYTKEAFLALIMMIVTLIPTVKYASYYNPNSYDTRFFTPLLPILTIGLAFLLKEVFLLSNRILKIVILTVAATLVTYSVFNSWVSTITHYAPHVTGEHRFELSQLNKPLLTFENIRLLFINTFPNIYNLHILLIYFALAFLIFYGARFLYKNTFKWIR